MPTPCNHAQASEAAMLTLAAALCTPRGSLADGALTTVYDVRLRVTTDWPAFRQLPATALPSPRRARVMAHRVSGELRRLVIDARPQVPICARVCPSPCGRHDVEVTFYGITERSTPAQLAAMVAEHIPIDDPLWAEVWQASTWADVGVEL